METKRLAQGSRFKARGKSLQPPASSLQPNRGFTLVEMLIVAAIFGGILLALFTSFMMGQGTYLSSNAYIQVQEEARRALDAVGRELREAGNVTGGGGQLGFQIALGYFTSSTQTGYVPGCPLTAVCYGAQDQTGANHCNDLGTSPCNWTIRYRLNDPPNQTQLIREILNGGVVQGTPRILANNVTAATFAYDGAKTVTVNLQTQVQPPAQGLGGAQTSGPLQTRVKLRN